MIPKTQGECADRLYKIKAKKAKLNRKIKELDEERVAIEKYLIDTLPKSKTSGVKGSDACATIVKKVVPTINDKEKFKKYMVDNDRFDLAHNLRLSSKAVADMWDEGEKVPGVEKFTAISVSITKV